MKLFNRKYNESEILNIGINFAMEFGENWLQPIQTMLQKKIKNLTPEELDKYNDDCKKALDDGIQILFELFNLIDEREPVKNDDLFNKWSVEVLKQYTWINDKTLRRLYRQGHYYAWKDGVSNGKFI